MFIEDYNFVDREIQDEQKIYYGQSLTQIKSDQNSFDEDQNQLNGQNNNDECLQVKQMKQTGFLGINNYPFKSDDIIKFSNELLITNDGVLRMISNSSQISFGFSQQSVLKVEQKFNLGVVDIQYEKIKQVNLQTIQQVMNYIQKFPIIQNQKANELLLKYEQIMMFLKSQISDINEQIEQLKDQELLLVSQGCFKILEIYNNENPNQMYSYIIGRVSYGCKELETVHTGYSKEYLNLLGLTDQSLSQIILRKQKIDLMKNINDITNQTFKGIEQMDCEQEDEYYTSHIVTFDGFPIKLYQKKKNFCELYKSKYNYGLEFEYILMIIEMDVDLYDLENLIQYRQRITQSEEKLNLDDFIRKELSFQFEDVEYSVHSQSFIDKYYYKNINNLKQFKKEKIDQDQQQQKQCNYRVIL